MLRIKCANPDCNRTYQVVPNALGRSVICKSCGFVFQAVPAEDSPNDGNPRRDSSAPKQPGLPKKSDSPDRIARFEVRASLGYGAFGRVYRAFDPQLDREVAIKIPQAGLLTSPELVERFLREAKAAARLNHPHIVPVYDAGRDSGQHYIASEYINGLPLSDLIDEYQDDFPRIAMLVQKLAEALDYAHSRGVIHRDIKPHNILVDAAGEPHILDFGLAHVSDAAQKLTHDGTLMGTPAYMSPEQAEGKADTITAASDQFSLGVVFYELLTGQTPFSGSPAVILFNILNHPLPTPRSLNPHVPRDLETIVVKMLSREFPARYSHCREAAADLRRWLSDEPIHARRVGLAERFTRWCRREPRLATLIMAVCFAALIAFGTVGIVLLDLQQQGKLSVAWSADAQAQQALDELKNERRDLQNRIVAGDNERASLQNRLVQVQQDSQAALTTQQTLRHELAVTQQQLKDVEHANSDSRSHSNAAGTPVSAGSDDLSNLDRAFNRLFHALLKSDAGTSQATPKSATRRSDIGGVLRVTSQPPPPVRIAEPIRPRLGDRFHLDVLKVLKHETFEDPTAADPLWRGQCIDGRLQVTSDSNNPVLLTPLPPRRLCRIRVRVQSEKIAVTQCVQLHGSRDIRISLTPQQEVAVDYSTLSVIANGNREETIDRVFNAAWVNIVNPSHEWNELVLAHLEHSLVLYINGWLIDEFSLENFPLTQPTLSYQCTTANDSGPWSGNVDEFTVFELPAASQVE